MSSLTPYREPTYWEKIRAIAQNLHTSYQEAKAYYYSPEGQAIVRELTNLYSGYKQLAIGYDTKAKFKIRKQQPMGKALVFVKDGPNPASGTENATNANYYSNAHKEGNFPINFKNSMSTRKSKGIMISKPRKWYDYTTSKGRVAYNVAKKRKYKKRNNKKWKLNKKLY